MDINILNALQARFGSADWSKYQVIRAQKYDFVRLNPGGVASVSFFTNPIGSTDPVGSNSKTLEQTNLVKSASFGQEFFAVAQVRTWFGLLPKARQPDALSGQSSIIYQGYTSLADNTMERLNNLANRGVLEIKLAQRLYWQLQQPFRTAPAGFGLDITNPGAAKLAAAVNRDNYWVRPNPCFGQVYVQDPIQIIEPEIQIEAALLFPDGNSPSFSNTAVNDTNVVGGAATPNIEVGLIFDGYTIRPVQ